MKYLIYLYILFKTSLVVVLYFIHSFIGGILFYTFFTGGRRNLFFKNFNFEKVFYKKLIYKNDIFIYAKMTSYWDYWRMYNYEKHPINLIEKELKRGKKNIIYYEIGANIGYSAILIAKLLKNKGTVYAIEIEPANFKTLSDNITINGLKNIIPLQLGLSSKERVTKFYYNIYHSKMNQMLPVSAVGAHSINFDEKLHDREVYFNVPLISFDKMILTFNLLKPTHVFIDTHGAELEVLESMENSINDLKLEKILIDIEDKEAESLEESKVYKKLKLNSFILESSEFEKASKGMTDSYKATFIRNEDK